MELCRRGQCPSTMSFPCMKGIARENRRFMVLFLKIMQWAVGSLNPAPSLSGCKKFSLVQGHYKVMVLKSPESNKEIPKLDKWIFKPNTVRYKL